MEISGRCEVDTALWAQRSNWSLVYRRVEWGHHRRRWRMWCSRRDWALEPVMKRDSERCRLHLSVFRDQKRRVVVCRLNIVRNTRVALGEWSRRQAWGTRHLLEWCHVLPKSAGVGSRRCRPVRVSRRLLDTDVRLQGIRAIDGDGEVGPQTSSQRRVIVFHSGLRLILVE